MTTRLPYGSWPSPISAAQVAAGTTPVGGGGFVGEELWWLEGRPAEGGRLTVLARAAASDAPARELVAAPFNVRSRVNEYGGASWAAVGTGDGQKLVFANFRDQRLYLVDAHGGTPVPLTPESSGADGDPALRFAEIIQGPGGHVLAICEDHRTQLRRYIAAIPLDGSAAADPAALLEVTASSRFVAAPRLNPSGSRISWISWEHPQMPWDGTELHVADLRDLAAANDRVLAGSTTESVLQPEWLDEDRLVFISDRNGWWNPYLHDLSSSAQRPLCEREEEFAGPLWTVGQSWYKVIDANTLLLTHGTHGSSLATLDVPSGKLQQLVLPFTRISPTGLRGNELLATATSLVQGDGLRLIDLDTLAVQNISLALKDLPDPEALPGAEAMEFTAADGSRVYAHVYEPRLGNLTGSTDELPPYVAFVHGGPTSQAFAQLSLSIAYYTSRGIGVVDVNYGGSTGFGRAYRRRLNGQWGVVDVQDTVAVLEGLAAAGMADPKRLAIEGGSAGGWTVLSALTTTKTFSAGISRYGVSDLVGLVRDTHDFESRYMDSLVGPYPEAAELYAQRAPINHVADISCPVLLLQGDQDKVVPPAQSQVVADALAANGIPHAYVLYEGEQHGFRRAENIVNALETSLGFYAAVFGFESDVPVLKLS
ncbi:S9 family peptidase [Paeniglutamicibacter psychrophenolicus]|uniref:S9 family peptidase n=1 Tax=Paeniglutamicibacter psychrophenolicus TaxID=257454 RepID=UPI00277EEA95|nr:prolyl oligopeptidase family serine peptidase [Paeniglutamicibacter psychrophenolicus]MDQ0094237.1 dipeptidyl aminopeptidase/acylaminoacyl peptidase [Paeniglutamicibacter psychrophenolicus]